MTASREMGKKAQKEPMSKWGFQPPNGAQILKFSKITYRFFNKILWGIYDPKFKIFGKILCNFHSYKLYKKVKKMTKSEK